MFVLCLTVSEGINKPTRRAYTGAIMTAFFAPAAGLL